MPPRGKKKSSTAPKSETSEPGDSISNYVARRTRSATKSQSTSLTSQPTPSTSQPIPSTSQPIPSTSKTRASTSKPTRKTTKTTRKPSKPTLNTSKSTRFTLKSTASTSKPVTFKSNSAPSTSKPKPRRKTKKRKTIPPPPNSVRFMSLLRNRELGLGRGRDCHFEDSAFDMKVGDFRRVKTHRFGNTDEVLHTVYFLRPGKNALIGAWYIQMKNMFTTAIGQLYYDLSRVAPGAVGYIVSKNTIVDACQVQVNPDCFVCVTSHVSKYTGELHVAAPRSRESNDYTIYKYSHPYERPFWCVNSNLFTEKFAVGCDREICVYSVTGIQEIRSIRDNVYSLAYNDDGSILHMGCETGEFVLHDLRTCQTTSRVKVDEQMLDDVLLLSNENYCIVSGVSGCLSKIDLRMNKVVVEYPNHDRRSRKIPVSVNEKFGLLSSSGADDATRIWCLKTGKLMKTLTAPSTYPARSCFVPGSMRGNIHLIQDNFIHVYCMLR